MRYKFLIPVFGILLLGASVAHAQISGSAVPDPLQFIVAPDTPGPNQLVYIQAQGVGSFLGNATVTWQVNGTTVSQGAGDTNFSFTTGGVGTATHVHVTIDSDTNGVMTHDFVFAPSVVDLVWEADTSAPLFYLGKPLYSAGSVLKVVAYPTIISGTSAVPSSKLSFQWSRGGSLVPASSGLGKDTFIFQGDEIQSSESISVDVYLGGAKVGHGEVVIPAVNPQILIYNKDPLKGELLDFALPQNFTLSENELTLQAEPYFFANSSLQDNALSYDWTLNGQETSGPNSAQGLLTLRQTSQGAGSAVVGVSIQNSEADKFTQAAQQSLQIAFGQTSGNLLSNLFGL